MMKRLILASTSPRRRALLKQAGIPFTAVASAYREDMHRHTNPVALVRELSQGKARAVARRFPRAVVLAADTVVVAGSRVLGKPRTRTEARDQLRILNGTTHTVLTGFTILEREKKKEITRVVATKVFFRKIGTQEMNTYLASGRWRGFAGGRRLL
jgi:septum formation protein